MATVFIGSSNMGGDIFPPVPSVAKIAASAAASRPVGAAVLGRATGPLPSSVSNQLRAAGPALSWLCFSACAALAAGCCHAC